MSRRPLALTAAVLLLVGTLQGVVSAAPSQARPPAPLPDDHQETGSDYRDGKALPVDVNGAALAVRPQARGARSGQQEVGERRSWPAIDDARGRLYVKDYALRGVGQNIEVWVASGTDEVASGLTFPAGDCRNDQRVEVTDAQVDYFIQQFDTNIYPKESAAFSVPPARDGAAARLPAALSLPADYYRGDGDNIVVLVDNVRDAHFYDRDNQNQRTFIAGFFSSQFNELLDRNVMTIDGYDWIHRTTATPPNEPAPGDLCRSAPARPFGYEGVLAHEYQHLLEYYEDPDETEWVNEGLSDYAQTLTGYVNPATPITETGFDSHVQCFLGYLGVQTAANPNPRPGGPENSLTRWGDQGEAGSSEILCDYGAAYTMMEFLVGRYGPGFMTALHRDDANGLASLQALLQRTERRTSAAEVLHDWAAMVALDGVLDRNGDRLMGGAASSFRTPTLDASVNWDTAETYSTPGAPPNGSDYVRLRNGDGGYLGAQQVRELSFDGSSTLPPAPVEWTVDAGPAGREGNATLSAGSASNLDRAIVRSVSVPAADPTLRFTSRFETEAGWDFGFVQVSTDGGRTYRSLANAVTTSTTAAGAAPGVTANLPGFSGDSGGWTEQSFDLGAYAGQDVLLAFRYVSDASVNGAGWWVDDVTVGAATVSDGSSLEGWRSVAQVLPVPVAGFTVQLVGYASGGTGPAFVRRVTLDAGFDATLTSADIRRLLGEGRADVVAAIVTYDEPTERVTPYAPYSLRVNGVLQPGG